MILLQNQTRTLKHHTKAPMINDNNEWHKTKLTAVFFLLSDVILLLARLGNMIIVFFTICTHTVTTNRQPEVI